MANEPFIDPQSRPDLTVDLNSRVGDLSVRQLSDVLGKSATSAKKVENKIVEHKQTVEKFIKEHPDKFPVKEHKEQKDNKDHKETKDHKDTKDNKDHKETKDHKDTKDNKDQKDTKEHKDGKDHKDTKEHKDSIKEHKDIIKDGIKDSIKDHIKEQIKEEIKEQINETNKQEIKDIKEGIKEGIKDEIEKLDDGPGETFPGETQQGIDSLIQRVSGLEQQVSDLQKTAAPKAGG